MQGWNDRAQRIEEGRDRLEPDWVYASECHYGEFQLAAVQTKQTGDMALLPGSQAFGFHSGWASCSICACLRHWTMVDVGHSCESCVFLYQTTIVTSGDTAKPDAKCC